MLACLPALLRLAGPGLPSVSAAAQAWRVPAPWLPEVLVRLAPAKTVWQALSLLTLLVPASLYLLLQGRRRAAAALALVLLLARVYLYGLNALNMTNYYHAHLLLLGVALLLPGKSFGVRAGLCAFYWLAGLSKLSPSWLGGEYFTALPNGLPLLPDSPAVIRLASLSVIVLELGGPFLLLSRKEVLRRGGLTAFALFHAYSILLVGAEYPFLFLPLLFAAFGPVPGAAEPRPPEGAGRLALAGLLLGVAALSCRHLLLPGARALTSEARQGGVYMFDAAAGCRAALELEWPGRAVFIRHETGYRGGVRWRDGRVDPPRDAVSAVLLERGRRAPLPVEDGAVRLDGRVLYDRRSACDVDKRVCCDPWFFHAQLARLRAAERPARAGLKLEVSLNGWPYWHALVDEPDFDPARLPYSFTRRNEWIRLADASAPAAYRWP